MSAWKAGEVRVGLVKLRYWMSDTLGGQELWFFNVGMAGLDGVVIVDGDGVDYGFGRGGVGKPGGVVDQNVSMVPMRPLYCCSPATGSRRVTWTVVLSW